MQNKQDKTEITGKASDISGRAIEKDGYVSPEIKVHPAIDAMEKAGESVVIITGFIGTSEGKVVRLYEALNILSYLEIPKDAIIHMEADKNGEQGSVRVFVGASNDILTVQQARLPATEFQLIPIRKFPPLNTCHGRCEEAFKPRVLEYLLALTKALKEQNPERQPVLLGQAENIKAQAKGALYHCLSECGRRYGSHYMIGSIERIYQEILVRYQMDDND